MSDHSLYFIAIIPPVNISRTLLGYKQEVASKFSSKAALRSPPHITLHMPFKLTSKKKVKLVKSLKSICFEQEAFPLTINGFGAFPPRVIYVQVEHSHRLASLQKDLGQVMAEKMFIHNLNYRNKPFKPHITIAFRDLKKERFAEAWEYYKPQSIRESFRVNSITLLKHNGQIWQPEVTISFQSEKT